MLITPTSKATADHVVVGAIDSAIADARDRSQLLKEKKKKEEKSRKRQFKREQVELLAL